MCIIYPVQIITIGGQQPTWRNTIYYVLTGLMVLMLVNNIIHNLYDILSRMYNLLYVDRYKQTNKQKHNKHITIFTSYI
jgi:hypothetical protein